MSSFTVRMQLARETKGTYLYRELGDQDRPVEDMRKGKLNAQYIRKSAFPEGAPDKIEVTVTTL